MKRRSFCLIPIFILICLLLNGCAKNAKTKSADYESTLFDKSIVHQIDVTLPDEDWDDLLKNPVDKTKYKANISIDGEEIEEVAFSTKGNSSLFFVADEPDAVRFSFKVNFGKYVDGQTYHGLDKLNLNNSFCDATYMKDYLSYELFRQTGVPAPLTSFAWVRVNGNDHGLYVAVEDVSDSFLDRVYDGEGVLYEPSPKSMGLTPEDIKEIKKHGLPMSNDPHGADLVYTDDNPESYPDIFDNAETDADETDTFRVISALKTLAEGKNIGKCIDTKEIIKFFAAHNFILNYDSYTGAMLHNLILYENKGKLSLLPWDYNLAYGTFTPGTGKQVLDDATDIVNLGIDSPLIGAVDSDRPMWKWIVSDDGYLAEYHDVFKTLISEYIESGEFDRDFDRISAMLLPYAEKDPTAFYTADEFRTGCAALRQLVHLRAESIKKQLDGELATVSANQLDSDKVDASKLRILDMGAAVFGE